MIRKENLMNTIETIMTRTSIRKFTDSELSGETVKTILKAGMSGPSAVNARDWAFIVVRNRETITKMADAKGRYSDPIRNCNVAILICGDLERAYKEAPDFWIIDGAIAGENMILAAKEMGVGSCWIGIYPHMGQVEAQAELFGLPEDKIPHSIIAFGYPDEEPAVKAPEWEEDRVHYENW